MRLVPDILVLLPVFGGCIYAVLCAVAVQIFRRRRAVPPELRAGDGFCPPVSILKPVHGLEKNLAANLRSACTQDYPDYQVVFSVQRLDDPALPLLRELEREFGSARVSAVAAESVPVVNGKIQNLINAVGAARHDYIVISDSDVLLTPDYLRTMMAPLSDPQVGYVCSLYRGTRADTWYERLESLTYNAEFVPSVLLAHVTGASGFCLGPSIALRRATLESIGGFESLADFLVEDFELGRRITERGLRMVLVNLVVDLVVDLASPRAWWQHQLYWDQNTWAAQPAGFIATILTKGIPFALLYACLQEFRLPGLLALLGAVAVRLGAAAWVLRLLQERVEIRDLALLPIRDIAALASWFAAISTRRFQWRGYEFSLTRGGRIVPRSS